MTTLTEPQEIRVTRKRAFSVSSEGGGQPILEVDTLTLAAALSGRLLVNYINPYGTSTEVQFGGDRLGIPEFAGDPSDAEDGDIWLNTVTSKLRGRQGGVNYDLMGGGPPGPPGERGEEGEMGLPGFPGAAGPEGRPGPIGPSGERGEEGEWGFPGPPGAVGAMGPAGLTGPQGDEGEWGLPGPVGPAGPAGAAGAAGAQGAIGIPGLEGDEGEPGLPGIPGNIGPQGDAGPIGVPGLDGEEGEMGVPGPAGAAGVAAHNLLDGVVHPDTVLQACSRGSLIYGTSGLLWDELIVGAVGTFLRADGADVYYGLILGGDIPANHSGSAHHVQLHGAADHNAAVLAAAFNENLGAFYMDIAQIAVPANPGAGVRRLFMDNATGELSVRTAAGATVSVEGGGTGAFAFFMGG